MELNAETIGALILLGTTIAGVFKSRAEAQKARYEALKAKAESERADEAERLTTVLVKGVEKHRANSSETPLHLAIKEEAESEHIEETLNKVVKEVTEGEGNVSKITRRFDPNKMGSLWDWKKE